MNTFKLIPASGISLATLLIATSVTHGQSVLLSASDFTVLGGTAITSTGPVGTRIINGDVGLSPGATSGITGFPPAVIENGEKVATGPVTSQARLDVIKLSAALALMPSDENLSNLDLAGMTLSPGVYTFNGAAALTGALILDGEGRADAFWVFQISSDLNTSLNATVTLINPGFDNGAGYGLFWNAGGAVNIGTGNTVAGNYISGTSVVFGGGSSGGGRALALAGVTLDTTVLNAFGGPAGGDWSGGLEYNQNGEIVPVSAIPEPASAAALAGAALLGFAALRRRRVVA
ncbi:MAG: DUF3494 domain-containing protein [Burkholderiales bacterium]|nr:DUF3494 domain-containing protein [Opitutaceae bacterium]